MLRADPPHPSPNVSSSQQGLAPLGSPFNLLSYPARRGSVCGLSPKPRPISFTAEFCNDTFRLQLLQVCPVSFESCHLRYNLHSTRQLQQKINGIGMPLHPTSGRSYPWSLSVNTKLVQLKHKIWSYNSYSLWCVIVISPFSRHHFFNTSISRIKVQVTFKVTHGGEELVLSG